MAAREEPRPRPSADRVGNSPVPTQYLLVACTELYTHFLLGNRSMETFKQFIVTELEPDAVIVHDRYQNYVSSQLGDLRGR